MVHREILPILISQEQELRLRKELKDFLIPLVAESSDIHREIKGLSFEQNIRGAEVYQDMNGHFYYYRSVPKEQLLEVGTFAVNDSAIGDLRVVQSVVEDICGTNLWKQLPSLPVRVDAIRQEATDLELSSYLFEGARVLQEPLARLLLDFSAQFGGQSLELFAMREPHFSEEEIAEAASRLEDAELVVSELEIYCSKTGKQLARFPSREALKEAAERGFLSPTNNLPIDQERIEQTVRATPTGLRLNHKSLWLALSAIDLLQEEELLQGEELLWKLDSDDASAQVFLLKNGMIVLLDFLGAWNDAGDILEAMQRYDYYQVDGSIVLAPLLVGQEVHRLVEEHVDYYGANMILRDDITMVPGGFETLIEVLNYESLRSTLESLKYLTRLPLSSHLADEYFGPSLDKPVALSEEDFLPQSWEGSDGNEIIDDSKEPEEVSVATSMLDEIEGFSGEAQEEEPEEAVDSEIVVPETVEKDSEVVATLDDELVAPTVEDEDNDEEEQGLTEDLDSLPLGLPDEDLLLANAPFSIKDLSQTLTKLHNSDLGVEELLISDDFVRLAQYSLSRPIQVTQEGQLVSKATDMKVMERAMVAPLVWKAARDTFVDGLSLPLEFIWLQGGEQGIAVAALDDDRLVTLEPNVTQLAPFLSNIQMNEDEALEFFSSVVDWEGVQGAFLSSQDGFVLEANGDLAGEGDIFAAMGGQLFNELDDLRAQAHLDYIGFVVIALKEQTVLGFRLGQDTILFLALESSEFLDKAFANLVELLLAR